ncbi:TusA-related sulfurtransferase [Halobacillus dabanensis]|uniref:TusA-related sulfurtransferase n=1 Tax=Halobacillus dabanensis TaxID=240302 RepID=A0A1I4AEJ8_HALDA|nr:sulfurtransferase TusA family protein [Halobacillus dabanensis]SFK54610.1 TusA-related sulfurtransferase [Halobacillus dabanensis]
MNVTKTLDATGLACPMPIVKTKKAMKDIEAGDVLEIQATDQGAKADLTAWAKSGGHELLQTEEDNGVFKFWIKKGE